MNLTTRPSARRAAAFAAICAAVCCAALSVTLTMRAQQSSGPKALVRHGFALNGTVEGSVQLLSGENTTLNGGGAITRDLLVPGTPSLRQGGRSTFGGVVQGSGGSEPSNYRVELRGSAQLGRLATRTDPAPMPEVAAPPAAAGTRDVTLSGANQSPGDFSTVRDLTLNSNVGAVAVPPGTYRSLTAGGGGAFILGVAGSAVPSVYNVNSLTLNGGSRLELAGPVVLTAASAVTLNGVMGSEGHPLWLTFKVAQGGVTLNGGSALYGSVAAPSGGVTINGKSSLVGALACDRLTVNGGGLLRLLQTDTTPPVVAFQQPADGAVTNATQVTATGTYSDEGPVSVTVNQVAATLADGGFSASVPLAEGVNTLTATATDSAGNQSSVARTVTRDTTPPALSVQQPAGGSVTSAASVTVAGSFSDATPTTVLVNGAPAAVSGGGYSATVALAEGTNEISVVATDAAGNQSQAPVVVVRDTDRPALALAQPADGLITAAAQVTVSGTCADATPLVVTVNGTQASLSGGAFSATVSLSDGANTLTVTATDAAGNRSELTRSVVRDNAGPKLNIIQPEENSVTRSVVVYGTTDDVSPVTVTVNGMPATPDGGTFAFPLTLADGPRRIKVVATDAAGNSTEVERPVTVDTTPPAVEQLNPAQGSLIASPTVRLTGHVSDATATLVSANGRPAAVAPDGSFAVEEFAVSEGENHVVISARDAAGNEAQTELVLNGKDRTQPAAPFIAAVVSPTRLSFQTVEGRAEPGASVTVVGGVEPVTVNAAFGSGLFAATVKLAAGVNALSVTATDADGNASAPAQVFVTSDPSMAKPPAGQPYQINISTGNAQKGVPSEELPRPLIAVVTDSAGQPVPNAEVRFTVTNGGGRLAGGAADGTLSVNTDADGHASAHYVAGGEAGTQTVRADFAGNTLTPAVFLAEALLAFPGAETAVSGVILDQNLRALPNVLVRLGGVQTRSGQDGRFVLENVPSGPHQLLELIGREQVSLPGRWPNITYDLDVLPGVDNNLGRPLFLPKMNGGVDVPLDQNGVVTQDTTYEVPVGGGEPPIRVTAKAGTHITFPPDVTDKRLSVTRIATNRVPMALEDGRATNLYISVQPSGAIFDPPLEMSFPNLDREPAGSGVLLMTFDHDAGRYVQMGTGHVSADGETVKTDPGSGIRVGAWNALPPRPPKPEVTVLGHIQVKGNPAFAGGKSLLDAEAWVEGTRAVLTTPPAALETADRWDYRATFVAPDNLTQAQMESRATIFVARLDADLIDQDVPTRDSFRPAREHEVLYAGTEPSTSDNVKLHLTLEDGIKSQIRSVRWSAKGTAAAPSYQPPEASRAALEWDVGDLPNRSGDLVFFAYITLRNGRSYSRLKMFDVGLRTDDMIIVGWIDPAGVVVPPTAGVNEIIQGIYPPNGVTPSARACNAGVARLAWHTLDWGTIYDPFSVSPFDTDIRLTAVDRIYLLRWFFKYSGNPDPASVIPDGNFRAGDHLSDEKVDNYLADPTRYKLYNRLQVKFLVTNDGLKDVRIVRRDVRLGSTHNPCGAVAGLLSVFPGQAGPANSNYIVDRGKVVHINDGSPDADGIRVINTLVGKPPTPDGGTPRFWENIGSAIRFELESGSNSVHFSYRVQDYPTYNIYANGRLLNIDPQAANPEDNFRENPYPFGTASCFRPGGTVPGGRCGDASSPPEPGVHTPEYVKP